MDHEQEVFTSLAEAREREQRAETPQEEAATGEQVKQAMVDIQARAEEYPELRSSESVQHLQEQISTIETQLADRRELYNKAATAQNEPVQQIPYLFFAGLAGVDQRELYDPPAEETTDVDVSQLGADAGEQTA
jgi:LemA protein